MADIKWTPPQKEAIYADGGNILVSAAAGSGKTAVLVQHLMRKVLDPDNPQEIDSFVVITFTKAAASQMKEKIRKNLNAALKDDPENEHIKRQLLKLPAAQISTIDSLCLDIVRENFHRADMDPSLRIAEGQETDIIKKKILEDILEENYASKKRDGSREAFLNFVESYIGRDDSKIEVLIEKIFRFAQSDAQPYMWMDKSIAAYKSAKKLDADGSAAPLWDYFKWYVQLLLGEINTLARSALELSLREHGPYKYIQFCENYIDMSERMLRELKEGQLMFSRLKEELEAAVPKKLPLFTSKKDRALVDMQLKDEAKELLGECKNIINSQLLEKFLYQSMEEHYSDLAQVSYVAETLINITKEFSGRFEAEKKARAIADFSDISHAALKVLIEHDDKGNMMRDECGRLVYTKTADSMARSISEIIVDEYQDTNLLQEYIITALSSERFGTPNVFMVGDMKQSIYRFRFAVPSLFTGKYDSYADGRKGKRIILGNNFRSRPEILNFANFIFSRIMTPQTGDIDYADNNELICSPLWHSEVPAGRLLPEVCIVRADTNSEGKKCEARLVARRIAEMVGKEEIEEDGVCRKIRYGDIAVLSPKNDASEIEAELEAGKIPHIKSSSKGFFDTFEISLLINLLKIIDNPYQDIPFTALLRSPLAQLEAQDLAVLKAGYEEKPFSMYAAVRKYMETESPELRLAAKKEESLSCFMEKLERCALRAPFLGSAQIVDMAAEEFSLYAVFSAMPGAEGITADIDLFYDMAASYKGPSGSSLFDFLRYIENMKKNGYDRGPAPVAAEGADAVQLMTVHRSKGLEFPVVFVVNTGNSYVENEAKEDIILDKDLGLGVDVRFTGTRIKKPTLAKNIIAAKIRREGRAEQMRVLYVALTRAKTRLIVTGTAKKVRPALPGVSGEDTRLFAGDIMKASSHLDLLMLALSEGCKNVCNLNVTEASAVEFEEFVLEETDMALKSSLKQMASQAQDADVRMRFSFEYPYAQAVKMPVKLTASGLENAAGKPDGFEEKAAKNEITQEGEVAPNSALKAGALRGNAYHRFFEILDFKEILKGADFLLKEAVKSGRLKEEEAGLMNPAKLDAFLSGDLAKRMARADAASLLRREQPYVMGIESCGETQIFQGITDAFFEEDGEIVLVDYKSDRGKKEEDFINVYKPQLDAYALAIEKALGKRVKEKVIYSVELEKSITL